MVKTVVFDMEIVLADNEMNEKHPDSKEIIFLERNQNTIDFFRYLDLQGVRIAVVSTNTREMLHKTLKRLGIDSFIKVMVTSDEVVNPKPHPEPFIRAMMGVGSSYEECVLFARTADSLASAVLTGAKVVQVLDLENMTIDFMKEKVGIR
jgi:beta-phosphoglucomutase-like phosphatase (HAD superfamily)